MYASLFISRLLKRSCVHRGRAKNPSQGMESGRTVEFYTPHAVESMVAVRNY